MTSVVIASVRAGSNRPEPKRGEIWIDNARRRWRVLEILSAVTWFSFRGVGCSVRFVGEAIC